MNTLLRLSGLVLAASLLLVACDDDDDNLVIPGAYDGTNFTTNASTQLAVRQQLLDLVTEMKKGRTAGTIVQFSTLNDLYNQAGNPTTLSAVSTAYYSGRINGSDGFFRNLADASGLGYTPGPPVGSGGVYGAYLFDENGLELEQLVEKGSFGAALYNHFDALANGTITEATVDQMVAIFGAHPDFPNSYLSANHTNPDIFAANYCARRDKNDGNGYYTRMRDQFIKLQAAVQQGFDAERDEAVAELRRLWELSNAATAVNYCHQTIAKLSETNPSDDDKASALHAYAEAVGFLHGWRTISNKTITDAEIDEVLVLLNAPYDGTATSYKFVTDPVNELPKLTQAIDRLANIYGFTAAEVEDFKQNWVTVQNR